MNISVLILSCERLDALTKTLERVVKDKLVSEVLVLDNSEFEDSRAAVRELCEKGKNKKKVKLIQEPFKPFQLSHMRNLGLDAATGDIIVLIDSDILPYSKDYFEQILAFHKDNKALLIHARYKEGKDKTVLHDLPDGTAKIDDPHREGHMERGRRPWRASSGGNCSFRKDVLGDKRFDTRFDGGWGWEDSDFTREFYDSGIELVFKNTICAIHQNHKVNKSFAESNYYKFFSKWNGRLRRRFCRFAEKFNIPYPGAGAALWFKDFDFTIKYPDNKKIIEFGCGNGALSHYLSCFSGFEVVVLDPYANEGHRDRDETLNLAARSYLKDAVSVVKCSALDFDSEERFDMAIMHNALHHICPLKGTITPEHEEFPLLVKACSVAYKHLLPGASLYIIDVLPLSKESVHYERVVVKGGVNPKTKHKPREWMTGLLAAGFENFNTTYLWPSEKNAPGITACTSLAKKLKLYGYKYILKATKAG